MKLGPGALGGLWWWEAGLIKTSYFPRLFNVNRLLPTYQLWCVVGESEKGLLPIKNVQYCRNSEPIYVESSVKIVISNWYKIKQIKVGISNVK